MLTKSWQRLFILAFGHGLNDFIAGYMLGNLLYLNTGMTALLAGFLAYNVLAFGGQYFAALFLERFGKTKTILIAAVLANLLALAIFHGIPHLSLVLAGIASAFYHVAGGAACLKENRSAPLAVFAAPGIVGLALAGYWSYMKVDVWAPLFMVSLVFVGLLQALALQPARQQEKKDPASHAAIDGHDLLMILLLGVISLRSAVWNIIQIIHEENYSWLLAIACSAFAGKMLGGWLSDRIGWRLYSFVSLIMAMPLLSVFREELILFCIGIGLLQSAIPANTMMMLAYCRGQREKAVAFSLGTGVLIGVVITSPFAFLSANVFSSVLLLLLAALSFYLLRNKYGLKGS